MASRTWNLWLAAFAGFTAGALPDEPLPWALFKLASVVVLLVLLVRLARREPPRLPDVRRLTLRPGDGLVFTFADPLTEDAIRRIKEDVEGLLRDRGMGDVPVLIVDSSVEVQVVGRQVAEPTP